jgi:tetratricopeptide (TPR) repeat protein
MTRALQPRFRFVVTVLCGTLLAGAILPVPDTLASSLPPPEAKRILDEGLDHFYNLEYDHAIANFEQLRNDDPSNASWQNHVALGYFYKQLFRAGALEGDLFGASNKYFRTKKLKTDPQLERGFKDANHNAIQICQERLENNESDQAALYSCGVAYAARATHQGLIERSILDSLGSARKANDYHSRLARLNPHYYDAYLIPGLYDFVLGSLPRAVKVLFFFTGLSGDKQRGIRMVEAVVRSGSGARHDARILLTVMYRREKRFADARQTIQELARQFPRNYILPLEVASLYRSAEEYPAAIQQYQLILSRVRDGVPNYNEAPVARIHFELGNLYKMSGELDRALEHLRQVPGARGGNAELEQEAAAVRQQIEEELAARRQQRAGVPR